MRLSRLGIIAAVVGSMTGCGKDDGPKPITIKTPDGTVSVKADEQGGKHVIETSQGKITYEADGKTVKIEGRDGDGKTQKVEYSANADMKAFDGCVYPGSALQSDSSVMTMKVGTQDNATGLFETSDPAGKIVEHYKKLLTGANASSFGPMSTVSGKSASGAEVSVVIITAANEKTKLTLSVRKG